MKRVHLISGLIIATFTAMHLVNHIASIFSIEAYINLMNGLRMIYRNPVVETILLLAVILQIYSGLKLYFITKKVDKTYYNNLHIWSGLYLAMFFIFHVSAVLLGRFFLKLDTNFYFGAAGLNIFPLNLFFVPYYILAVFSMFGHISAIHFKRMKSDIFNVSPNGQAFAIQAMGLIVGVLIIYGMTNQFQGREIPDQYNLLLLK